MTLPLTLLAATIVLAFGCASSTERSENVNARANTLLDVARADWNNQQTESNAIWVGRRIAYLGQYDEAIDWYRNALQQFPDSYRIRRHLGHRLISVRRFNEAVEVLTEARNIAAAHPNRIESDGAPNASDSPRSSTHGNIDYHLALAHYCLGQFDDAARYWNNCVTTWALTDDSKIAALHWLHLSLHRAGKPDQAQQALAHMPENPDIIENDSYATLVRIYQGRVDPESLTSTGNSPSGAALEYGLARYWIRQGNGYRGNTMLRALVNAPDGQASFGTIAAEADLKRLANIR